MCEMAVCAISEKSDDIYTEVKSPKRGDVIIIVENGHNWSPSELADPRWVVLKFPDLTVKEMSYMLSPEPATSTEQNLKPNTLQFRAWYFDLNARISICRRPSVTDPGVIG